MSRFALSLSLLLAFFFNLNFVRLNPTYNPQPGNPQNPNPWNHPNPQNPNTQNHPNPENPSPFPPGPCNPSPKSPNSALPDLNRPVAETTKAQHDAANKDQQACHDDGSAFAACARFTNETYKLEATCKPSGQIKLKFSDCTVPFPGPMAYCSLKSNHKLQFLVSHYSGGHLLAWDPTQDKNVFYPWARSSDGEKSNKFS